MNGINHARRGFLRGKVRSEPPPLRPPGARPEQAFLSSCSRCGRCASACPTKIIVLVDGYPQLDFALGQCTFCAQCIAACPDNALRLTEGSPPWDARAHIGEACLAQRGIECRVCGEHCELSAIRFPPRVGTVPAPAVNAEMCTGCGACCAPCPVSAITVR